MSLQTVEIEAFSGPTSVLIGGGNQPTIVYINQGPAGAAGINTWGSITGTLSSQTDLQTALNLKANLASPTFTGTVTAPIGYINEGYFNQLLVSDQNNIYDYASFGSNDGTFIFNYQTNGQVIAIDTSTRTLELVSGASDYIYTFPNLSGTVALSNQSQTFTADQTFSQIVSLSNPQQSTDLSTGALRVVGGAYITKNLNVGGILATVASTTTTANLKVPHGSAPTSPVNGDVWTTTTGSFIRINGTTRQTATLSDTQSFSGNQTFAGTAAFTNTDRPTSSGSSTLAATSLMTRDDVDSSAFDNFGRTIQIFNPTVAFSGAGGFVQTGNPTYIADIRTGSAANAYARATINRSLNQAAEITGGGIDFSNPTAIALRLMLNMSDTIHKLRLVVGGNGGVPATADNDALAVVGYGFEVALNASNFLTIASFRHNGTTYVRATPTVTTFTTSTVSSQFFTFVLTNNGSGTITTQMKTGRTVLFTSTQTGGPTTSGVLTNSYTDLVAVNGASSAAQIRCSLQNAMIRLY